MKGERILVGLSGGVDSAAVAKILLDRGYRVHGAYLSLCPASDEAKAREVAKKLDIPFTVIKGERRFDEKVVKPFLRTYEKGETPNPCVECNRFVKIALLLSEADRLGIFRVATGHYAGIGEEGGRTCLLVGRDENKDQSYFLWKLTQKQLSRLMFPLSGMEKSEVRKRGLPYVSEKEKESMEVCFIPDGNTERFLSENAGDAGPGDFVDASGNVLGRHKGICHYTVGQRRGLGVSSGERLFVLRILPEENRILLGPETELYTDRIRVEELHYVSVLKRKVPRSGVVMKGRNRGKGIPCNLSFDRNGVTVSFLQPVRRFSGGQSACFYENGRLLFGGVIKT